MAKILEKSGKSQGILSVRKSGNPACEKITFPQLRWRAVKKRPDIKIFRPWPILLLNWIVSVTGSDVELLLGRARLLLVPEDRTVAERHTRTRHQHPHWTPGTAERGETLETLDECEWTLKNRSHLTSAFAVSFNHCCQMQILSMKTIICFHGTHS